MCRSTRVQASTGAGVTGVAAAAAGASVLAAAAGAFFEEVAFAAVVDELLRVRVARVFV